MNEAIESDERPQSPGEEIANSVSHGVGLVAALVAVPILIVAAVRRGDAAGIVGASVFAGTMVLLYLASTLYHALPRNKAKHVFQVLDHVAIFLLIAGTYTPFTLGVLRGGWGWTLFGLVWSLAVLGIAWHSPEDCWSHSDSVALDLSLPRNGMACPSRDSAFVAPHAIVGLSVARGWGARVHRRRGVLYS
jgi:predicted membrane channel-forming protein YqfA (hemolysin III family)